MPKWSWLSTSGWPSSLRPSKRRPGGRAHERLLVLAGEDRAAGGVVGQPEAGPRRPLAVRRRLDGDRVAALDELADQPDEDARAVLHGEDVGDVRAVALDADVVDVDAVGHRHRDSASPPVTWSGALETTSIRKRSAPPPSAGAGVAATGTAVGERGDERERDGGGDEPGT